MWSEYMKEADTFDTLVSDLWKDDADGVLVFVSPDIRSRAFRGLISFQDRSVVRRRGHILGGKLSNVISRFRRRDGVSP
jgi:hypothetical protein